MERLGIRYDLLAHERDILRLQFWESASAQLKAKGAIRLEHEGKNAGCWVLSMADQEGLSDEDKIIVRSNGTVTYTGKDIAYQFWKLGLLGRDFYYRPFGTRLNGGTLWTTSAESTEGTPPRFGGATSTYNVIDVRQS